MSVLQFRKAERKKAKLRLGISGPAGSGKTYASLQIAIGLKEKIAMIDTENGSGDLYADICDYDILQITAPFTPDKYIQAIKAAEEAEYGTIIIDSLSHAWAGEGGLLDLHGKIADSGKGNSYTAWRFVTPKHNALVEAMLQSRCHIIATMRAKMDYVQQTNNGKTEIRKVGLAPVQRDGMEYEFTVFLDLNHDHTATASKDRTRLFDGQYFIPSQETGKILKKWLESGVVIVESPAKPANAEVTPINKVKSLPEKTEIATTEEPGPETINEADIIATIKEAMSQASSLQELEKICGAYRADYDRLSEKGKETIKREKKAIAVKLKANAA